MKRTILCATAASALLLPRVSRVDFKHAESTKFTCGARAGLIKFAASAAGKGDGSDRTSYCIKENRMRVEGSDGEIQTIDLDARHIMRIDPKKKTCGIITFAEMRAQLEQLRQLRNLDARIC